MKHKLLQGSHHVGDHIYVEGDVIENVPQRTVRANPGRFEPVHETTPVSEGIFVGSAASDEELETAVNALPSDSKEEEL